MSATVTQVIEITHGTPAAEVRAALAEIPDGHVAVGVSAKLFLRKPEPDTSSGIGNSIGADVLAGAVLQALAAAGTVPVWDSGTIEAVLEPLGTVMKAYVPSLNDTEAWRELADKLGIDYDQ